VIDFNYLFEEYKKEKQTEKENSLSNIDKYGRYGYFNNAYNSDDNNYHKINKKKDEITIDEFKLMVIFFLIFIHFFSL